MKFACISEEDKAEQLYYKPIRNCKSMHECCICNKMIFIGYDYYDGGYRKQAHKKCVENLLFSNTR